MKKFRIPFLAMLFALGFSACGSSAGDRGVEPNDGATIGTAESDDTLAAGTAESGDTLAAGGTEPDGAATVGNLIHGNTASSEIPGSPADDGEGGTNSGEHSHSLSEGNNIVDHETAGYCGNTVTTVSFRGSDLCGEPWEVSFWGSDSVALTDLLLYLDYSEGTCRCMPEYTVDTEFGTGYGINLTEGYARHDGGQVSLTEEQIGQIQEILDRQAGKSE